MDGTTETAPETPVDALQHQVGQLTAEVAYYRKLYTDLLAQFKRLERGLITGKKAERITDDGAVEQLSMQLLGMMFSAREGETAAASDEPSAPSEEAQEGPSPKDADAASGGEGTHAGRRAPGRKRPPEEFPRIRFEVLPPEVERQGLDAFVRIGEEVSEVVERRRAAIVVVQIVRPKFVRKGEVSAVSTTGPSPKGSTCSAPAPAGADETPVETVVWIADPPERPIERGVAGPGLLADTIVHRWQDHLPLYRLEGLYAREGLRVARSTMCGWHEQLADLVEPLTEAMLRDALTQPVLCTDATGVLVQAEKECQRAHFWVLVAPGRHVLYRYSLKHDRDATRRLLGEYRGYLVADAHSVYDHLYATGDVIEVGCWVHCRRYFYQALGSDPARAQHALALILGLFKVERTHKTSPRKKLEAARREKSAPIVDAFFAWCEQQAAEVLPGTPIARAIGYARNQRVALSRFLADGRLPLENNISERNLRREVIGRKNWLFLGSDEGARANTIFVSLLASCQLHGIEPWAYLRDLLCLLPSWPKRRILELAPAFWKQTSEQQDTQQRLAANIFRALTLTEHAPTV